MRRTLHQSRCVTQTGRTSPSGAEERAHREEVAVALVLEDAPGDLGVPEVGGAREEAPRVRRRGRSWCPRRSARRAPTTPPPTRAAGPPRAGGGPRGRRRSSATRTRSRFQVATSRSPGTSETPTGPVAGGSAGTASTSQASSTRPGPPQAVGDVGGVEGLARSGSSAGARASACTAARRSSPPSQCHGEVSWPPHGEAHQAV